MIRQRLLRNFFPDLQTAFERAPSLEVAQYQSQSDRPEAAYTVCTSDSSESGSATRNLKSAIGNAGTFGAANSEFTKCSLCEFGRQARPLFWK